jgi:hypothetical protein
MRDRRQSAQKLPARSYMTFGTHIFCSHFYKRVS